MELELECMRAHDGYCYASAKLKQLQLVDGIHRPENVYATQIKANVIFFFSAGFAFVKQYYNCFCSSSATSVLTCMHWHVRGRLCTRHLHHNASCVIMQLLIGFH